MALIRAETLRTHEDRMEILQPSGSFSACSDTAPPLEASMQPVPLAKLGTCQDQTNPFCECSHGTSQMKRCEVDPFLLFAKHGNKSMNSETLLVVDEVRLMFNYKLTFSCNCGLIETDKV